MFMKALEKEGVKSFSRQLSLADVARFEYFRNGPAANLEFGLSAREISIFALPFVTGPNAATSDYEAGASWISWFRCARGEGLPVHGPF